MGQYIKTLGMLH